MDIRTYSLCALMLVINEVSSQSITVEAAVGDSVILPCSSSHHEKDVFWRYRDAKTVYEIIDGKENFHDQDGEYRDRVKGFPSEFTKGNYSIRLSDVKLNDTGTYSCQIPNFRTVRVKLQVNVSSQSVTVEAAVGDSVILPCLSSPHEKDVFWRYRDTKTVYDIINGKENFHDQDGEYRDRVKGFPSEFTKGNYSIRLSDVKLNDKGTYSCQIPNFRPVRVKLQVNDSSWKTSPNNSGIVRKAGSISSLVISVLLYSFAF